MPGNKLYSVCVILSIVCFSSSTAYSHINLLDLQSALFFQQSERAWLGFEAADVTPQIAGIAGLDKVQGAVVQRVAANSPAEKAGLLRGDIIMSLNGRRVRTAEELRNDISGLEVGAKAQMCVTREDYYRTTVYAIPETAPSWLPREEKTAPWLGVRVSEVAPGSSESSELEDHGKEGGVLVEQVGPGSPADKAGLQPGDVIMSFNSRKVRTVREFLIDLSGAEVGDRVRLCIMRGDIRKTLYTVLTGRPQTSLRLISQNEQILNETYLSEVLPQADRFERILQPVAHYKGYKGDGFVGAAFITTEVCPEKTWGYQSSISTLVGVNAQGRIVGVKILAHSENPNYTRGLLSKFVSQFIDKDISSNFVLGQDIDAITGATVSSSAINRSIKACLFIISSAVLTGGASRPETQVKKPVLWQDIVLNMDFVLLVLIVGLALYGYFREKRLIRYFTFGMAFVYIGLLKGGGLSTNDLISILQSDYSVIPAIVDNVYRYGLLLAVIVSTVLIGRFYCGWLCPFGFFTESLHRLGGSKKSVPYNTDAWLRSIKYVLLLAILFIAFVAGKSEGASIIVNTFEPFGTLFRLDDNGFGWLFLILIIVLSFFISRVYCRYLCPVGAFLAVLVLLSSLIKRLVFKNYRPQNHYGRCPMDAIRYDRVFKQLGIDNNECIKCNEATYGKEPKRYSSCMKPAISDDGNTANPRN